MCVCVRVRARMRTHVDDLIDNASVGMHAYVHGK